MDADKFVANIGKPTDFKALSGVSKVVTRGIMADFIQQNGLKDEGTPPKPPKKDVPRNKAESVSMRATGQASLTKLSEAPIQAYMEAYNKAVHEDNDPETAKTIRSIITAKLSDNNGLAGLDAATRVQLAAMLKDEPHLKDLSDERTLMRGAS